MKKEVFAAVLLVVMLIMSVVNIYCLENLTGEVAGLASLSGENAKRGEWQAAVENGKKALEKWEKSGTYTHIVLRHSDIDAASAELYELMKELYSQNSGGALGAAEAVCQHMDSISSVEKIRFDSVF